jgi:CheY-like chemotaxis protein
MNVDPIEIVLVEDNPNDIELTQRALKRHKIANRVMVARDGEEALEFIFGEGRYAGRNVLETPRVIFLDIKLPKVDGLAVLRRIKSDERTKRIPVVMLTSSEQEKDILNSYTYGVNSYIVKPIDFDKFSMAVSQLGLYWVVLNKPPAP